MSRRPAPCPRRYARSRTPRSRPSRLRRIRCRVSPAAPRCSSWTAGCSRSTTTHSACRGSTPLAGRHSAAARGRRRRTVESRQAGLRIGRTDSGRRRPRARIRFHREALHRRTHRRGELGDAAPQIGAIRFGTRRARVGRAHRTSKARSSPASGCGSSTVPPAGRPTRASTCRSPLLHGGEPRVLAVQSSSSARSKACGSGSPTSPRSATDAACFSRPPKTLRMRSQTGRYQAPSSACSSGAQAAAAQAGHAFSIATGARARTSRGHRARSRPPRRLVADGLGRRARARDAAQDRAPRLRLITRKFARRIRAVMPTTATRVRLVLWLLFVAAFVLLYWSRASTWRSEFRDVAASSLLLGYALYLALGCVRGFTLIPAANLVLLAIPIFPPSPLLALTLVGILVSSASIYAFAGSLHLAEYFERSTPRKWRAYARRSRATRRRS